MDLSFQPTSETWGHASQSAEMPSEMALVGKPRGQSDFRQWQLSLAEHVLNVLARLKPSPRIDSVETALTLNQAPLADTGRYDRLREQDSNEEADHA